MKKFIAIIAVCACALSAAAQVAYETASVRASRAFANGEWATAAAYYNHMLREKPEQCATYGRAIVANEMIGDTIVPMQLLDQAMHYGMPLDSVLSDVQSCSFQIGQGNLYEQFLLTAVDTHSWLKRPLESSLLRYYEFRSNGPMVVEYAQKMLAGSPGSPKFMLALANGYMLCSEPQKAEQTWLELLKAHPNNYEATLALANFYDLNADKSSALKMFEAAYALRPTPYVAQRIEQLSGAKIKR